MPRQQVGTDEDNVVGKKRRLTDTVITETLCYSKHCQTTVSLSVCRHQIPSVLNRFHGGQWSSMILTSPPRSKDQKDNWEKDNTAQNNKKQLDVHPNAAMIQNQNPNPWISCGSYILRSFQCISTSYDFSMMIRIIQDCGSSSSKVEIRPHHQAHPPHPSHVAAPLGFPVVVRWRTQPLHVARSLTSLPPNGQWLRRECFVSVEPGRPRALMIEVVVVHSEEDISHALPKRMANEDVTRMQCRTAADIVSTYSVHAIQYSAMRQYASAQKHKWPLNRQRWLIYRQLGQHSIDLTMGNEKVHKRKFSMVWTSDSEQSINILYWRFVF